MTQSEILRIKAQGVEDMVKWLKDECKKQRTRVTEAEANLRAFGMFEDCAPSYEAGLSREQGAMGELVRAKIAAEWYMKKLRHQAREAEENG